jgi:hypothetical protein
VKAREAVLFLHVHNEVESHDRCVADTLLCYVTLKLVDMLTPKLVDMLTHKLGAS